MCRRDSAISLAIRSSASLKHTHTQSVLQQWKYAPKQHRSKKLELCFKTTHTYSSWACCSSFLRRLICSWSSSRFPVLRLPSDPSFCRKWNTHKEKKRLKVRRGENSKGTNTKRKAGASATFGLAMHYALCIILTFERKPLAWILCPSFWQSENLWENKPCQWAQISSTQTLSPQKQLVLTGCRGKKEPEKQQKARSSPTPLCRSERPPPQWKRGNKRSLPAHETPLILLHTHYKDAHTEKKETKRGSRTVLLLGGLFHISVTYHWLWRYILFSLSSRPPQDRL